MVGNSTTKKNVIFFLITLQGLICMNYVKSKHNCLRAARTNNLEK